MSQDNVSVSNIHLEHGVGQGFYDRALEFDYIVFCQSNIPPKSVAGVCPYISSAIVRISGAPSVISTVFS